VPNAILSAEDVCFDRPDFGEIGGGASQSVVQKESKESWPLASMERNNGIHSSSLRAVGPVIDDANATSDVLEEYLNIHRR
jgi:hypothetical protein